MLLALHIMLPLLSTMPLPTMQLQLSTMLLPTMLLLLTSFMSSQNTTVQLLMLLNLLKCAPAFETVCENIEVPVKRIIDIEQCYPVTRTVCSESVEVIPNEICVYSYQQKVVNTTAKTVEIPYEKQCDTQMVTVYQPTPGYGYHSYGHNYFQT